MNNTNAKMEAIESISIFSDYPEPTDPVHIKLEFDLVHEDWQLLKEHKAFMNEHMQRDDDLGDTLLSLLTWAIHQAYEQRTGKPFILRMDRPKN